MSEPQPPGHPTGLDVLTPLRGAREHSVKDVLGWLVAFAVVAGAVTFFGSALGWPAADYRVSGQVVDRAVVADGTVVTFEGQGGGHRVRWQRLVEDNAWDLGEAAEGWVVDGRFHTDLGLAWTGPADTIFVVLVLLFAGLAARRLLGLVIALLDVRRPGDRPRRGYAALVGNPVPRSMRKIVLIWWDDRRPATVSRPPTGRCSPTRRRGPT